MKNFLACILVISAAISSCQMMGERVKGNGNIITEKRTISSFTEVDVEGAIDVYITQGDIKPIQIQGDENLLPYIEIRQEGDRLIVRNRDGYNLNPTEDMKIFITGPVFNSIDVSGACDIIGQSKISNAEPMRMRVSGAGEMKMEIDAPKVTAEISGAGSVDLKGQTKEFDLGLSGAGGAHCYDLLSENTTVDISGAGDAEVYASVKLDAEVSGAGSVKYKGNATDVKQQVHGAGSVTKVN